MILPDKNITLHHSILGMGTKMLLELNTPHTVSSLWEKLRKCDEINTFEKFILTLDFLYIIGLIDLERGIIRGMLK